MRYEDMKPPVRDDQQLEIFNLRNRIAVLEESRERLLAKVADLEVANKELRNACQLLLENQNA